MYGNLRNKNEVGMRWFDFYLKIFVPISAIIKTYPLPDYFEQQNYLAIIFQFVLLILDVCTFIIYLPHIKSTIRKYPASLFYFVICENAFALINCTISIVAAFIILDFSTVSSLAYTITFFVINIVYFVKRKKFFSLFTKNTKATLKPINNTDENEVDPLDR